jgi:hypothetical protein
MAGNVFSQIVVGLLLHGIVTAALLAWSRAIARRHSGPWWQKQVRLPWLGFAFAVAGLVLAGVLMTRAWNAVGSENASNKATRLAEGISLSLDWGALFIVAGWLLYAISVVTCIAGAIKKPSRLPAATAIAKR